RVAATKYSCRTCVEKTAVCSLKCVARSLRAVFFFCGSSAPCAWTRTFVSKNRRSATIRLAVGDGDDPRTARRDRTCSSWEDDREDACPLRATALRAGPRAPHLHESPPASRCTAGRAPAGWFPAERPPASPSRPACRRPRGSDSCTQFTCAHVVCQEAKGVREDMCPACARDASAAEIPIKDRQVETCMGVAFAEKRRRPRNPQEFRG